MAAQPVEWVLVVYYGPSAHRAIYGRRIGGTKYTKDYIQLSRKPDLFSALSQLVPAGNRSSGTVPITYQWHNGNSPGALVFKSADRPHLKWNINDAPRAWKMSLTPSETTAETIPGDPSRLDFAGAENELKLFSRRGAGQPYLFAIKLQGEQAKLHLRVYLKNPSAKYAWADLRQAPSDIQALATKTSNRSALAWSVFQSARSGTFFDPARNHDAWSSPAVGSRQAVMPANRLLQEVDARLSADADSDAAAEASETDPQEVQVFREQIDQRSFEVPDSLATVKTRGSAQRAFAEAVKSNYGCRCAITGIVTRSFLVASHIVPWSKDQTIRLDPSNGICLSLLMDRAFEKGHIVIEDDLTIRIDDTLVGIDLALRKQLEGYDGKKLRVPKKQRPRVEYLRRRRSLNASSK
jgi:hypothetical protein